MSAWCMQLAGSTAVITCGAELICPCAVLSLGAELFRELVVKAFMVSSSLGAAAQARLTPCSDSPSLSCCAGVGSAMCTPVLSTGGQ